MIIHAMASIVPSSLVIFGVRLLRCSFYFGGQPQPQDSGMSDKALALTLFLYNDWMPMRES